MQFTGDVIVEFEYEAKEDDELTLNVGEIITNVVKVNDGWCEGSLNGKRGMFPDNFVKEYKKEKPALPNLPSKKVAAPVAPAGAPEPNKSNAGTTDLRNRLGSLIANPAPLVAGASVPPSAGKRSNKKAKVTHEYEPKNPDELALEIGQVVEILKQEEEGWWEGSINGKIGMFPSNFVEVIDATEQPPTEEVTEIRGRRVQGVGFGNIFGGGPINLRPTPAVPAKKDKEPQTPEGELENKFVREGPRASVKAKVHTPSASSVATVTAAQVPVAADTKQHPRAVVRYPYTAANDDELSLSEGDIINVLDQNLADAGWWKGELMGVVGVFPDNFVELLPNTESKPQRPPVPVIPANNGVAATSVETGIVKPKKDGPKEPPARPPSMVIDKGALPKVPVAPGKVLESKPSIETDDHKAKSQEVKGNDVYRSGTLDRAVASENPLKALTVDRPKIAAGRRPPNMAARREPAIPETEVKKEEKVVPAAISRQATKEEEKVVPAAVSRQAAKEEHVSRHVKEEAVIRNHVAKEEPLPGKKEVVASPVRGEGHQPLTSKHSLPVSDAPVVSHADLVQLQHEMARLREDLDQMKRLHDKRLNGLVAELDEEKKTRLNLQVEIDRLKKRLAE